MRREEREDAAPREATAGSAGSADDRIPLLKTKFGSAENGFVVEFLAAVLCYSTVKGTVPPVLPESRHGQRNLEVITCTGRNLVSPPPFGNPGWKWGSMRGSSVL